MTTTQLVENEIDAAKKEGNEYKAAFFKKFLEKQTVYVSDFDDKLWDSGIAKWLQDHTKWFNYGNGFKSILIYA